MTLKGVDISNWQKGLVPSSLGVDFAICKATEGLGYVDKTCDPFISDCIKSNMLWGFYHFARENSATDEAQFFYDNCKGYIGRGIPVLDYEVWDSGNDHVKWCELFLRHFHNLSGVWPLVYISASHCRDFEGSWIPQMCGLWVAGYPKTYTDWPSEKLPYNVTPWAICAIWQFSENLRIGNTSKLDGDFAYMDRNGWALYASPNASENVPGTTPDKSCEILADEVLAGLWGNGWNREQALTAAYGAATYQHVQRIVNERLGQ